MFHMLEPVMVNTYGFIVRADLLMHTFQHILDIPSLTDHFYAISNLHTDNHHIFYGILQLRP